MRNCRGYRLTPPREKASVPAQSLDVIYSFGFFFRLLYDRTQPPPESLPSAPGGMHVLVVTDNFVPERNAPAKRTYEHCQRWVKAGVQVTVITSAPNFPSGTLM